MQLESPNVQFSLTAVSRCTAGCGGVGFLSDVQYNAFLGSVLYVVAAPVSRQLLAARRQTVTLYSQLKNSTPAVTLIHAIPYFSSDIQR